MGGRGHPSFNNWAQCLKHKRIGNFVSHGDNFFYSRARIWCIICYSKNHQSQGHWVGSDNLCSEGKTIRLIKRHHCTSFHFHFKVSQPHMLEAFKALKLQYLWDICSTYSFPFCEHIIWDLCYIPHGKFPIKHIRLDSCYYFTSETTRKVCSSNTGMNCIM